jgi:hypothetical protein
MVDEQSFAEEIFGFRAYQAGKTPRLPPLDLAGTLFPVIWFALQVHYRQNV